MRFSKFFLGIAFLLFIVGIIAYMKWHAAHRHDEQLLYGNVDVRQVDISFRVAGQVEELLFEEGDYVTQGQLLARLDKAPYDKQFEEAEAAVRLAKAAFDNGSTLYKRRQELIDSGGVSLEDLQTSDSSYQQLKASFDQAQAALKVAADNLAWTEVYSPSDGIILTRIREPGTVVNATDPVYTLSLTSPVWVRAYVSEPYLGKVHFGMEATIFTDTPGGKVYTGKVGFISPVAEFTPKTVQTTDLRTDLVYRLRIYADNPDAGLKQGMPVTVRLQ